MDTESKLDKIEASIGQISVTLAAQHVTLKEHAKRSDGLETQAGLIQAQMLILKQSYDEFQGALKFLKVAAAMTGVVAALLEAIEIWIRLKL